MFFTDGKRRKRKRQRIIAATCKIVGGVIVVFAILKGVLL